MSIELLGPGALDYQPCRYGASKLTFRGPRRELEQPYVAFVGGTETYGKFLQEPFPALLEAKLAQTCVNFGTLNAGVDLFVRDPFVLNAASEAQTTVVQVLGAHNMTNRFYSVHPRRNDRFIAASALLKTIYREVDFADFNFTRHMLNDLLSVSPERFETVRTELQQAWMARMQMMLRGIKGRVILLWFATKPPPEARDINVCKLGHDPLFITRKMIDDLIPMVDEFVEVNASHKALKAGTKGMVFSELEAPAAKQMLGPKAHEEAAAALLQAFENQKKT